MENTFHIRFLIDKYQKQIDNLKWHIETNKPQIDERLKCMQRISDFSDVVYDLKQLTDRS